MTDKIPDYFIECHTARLARIKEEIEDMYKHDPLGAKRIMMHYAQHKMIRGASIAIHGIVIGDDDASQ